MQFGLENPAIRNAWGATRSVSLVSGSGANLYRGSLEEIRKVVLYGGRNLFLTPRRGKTFNEYGAPHSIRSMRFF